MALKHKIDEAAFKKLPKDVQAEYKKAEGSEDYVLEVEGLEDTGALKRAKEHETERRKKAEKDLKDLETKVEEAQAELAELRDTKAKAGDAVASETKKWEAKLAKREKELADANGSLQKALQDQMVANVAMSVATELAGDNAELLLPHIQKRLVAEFKDGKVATKVLGADGEVSALTTDELKKEVLSSGKFAAVVVASKGSGSGGAGSRKGAGGSPATKKLSEMTATEEATFAREHPDKYKEMAAAEPVGFKPATAPARA